MKNLLTELMLDQIENLLILKIDKFEGIVRKLKNRLSSAWGTQVEDTLKECLDYAETFNGTSEALYAALEKKMKNDLGTGFAETVNKPVISAIKNSYVLGAESALEQVPTVSFAWMEQDLNSLSVLDETQKWWIGEYYSDNVQQVLEQTLKPYFEGNAGVGMARRDIIEALQNSFSYIEEPSKGYWDLLADHICTQTRSIGTVSGYEQGGIEVVRVKAHIDNRTTEICLALDGQIISVKDLRTFVDKYEKACKTKNKEKIKKAWPMRQDKWAKEKLTSPKKIASLVKKGEIGLPPYHFRCRTITVAEFYAAEGENLGEKFAEKEDAS